jgi:hypothetical protein
MAYAYEAMSFEDEEMQFKRREKSYEKKEVLIIDGIKRFEGGIEKNTNSVRRVRKV